MYDHVFHFFGLRENPFHVSPDPRFFCSTRAHDSALENLKMGVETRQGFMVVTGEAGTGKTILLHHFLNWLQSRKQSSCYIFQSQLKAVELFELVLRDFGVPCDSRRTGDLMAALRLWLMQRHALGDSPVLVIDEAQAISLRTLDRLRMLLNLETPEGKLLQIVLAGQPRLEEKLRRPELRQLHQRIVFRSILSAFSIEETTEYVKARLTMGGAKDAGLFRDESLEAIHIYAEGVPRVVNLLCEHAILRAFAEKQTVITPGAISRVAASFELSPQPSPDAQHKLPRFERTAPHYKNGTSVRPAHEVIELASDELKENDVSFANVESQQIRPELKSKPEPRHEKVGGLILTATAAAVAARSAMPPRRKAQSPIVALVIQDQPEEVVLAPVVSRELPISRRWPGVNDRFLTYWRSVEQSFMRDFRQFLQAIL
jgi:general secretion pathway protein A